MKFVLCENESSLDAFFAGVSEAKRIGLDFEGESNLHRYGIHLCLAQVALEDGSIYLLDPMRLGEVFSRLNDVWTNPNLTKVMFSPDFDVRLLHYTTGNELRGIFDVQLAAKWLGFEKTGLDSILNQLGLDCPGPGKSDQTSDWSQRPLTNSQLEYAAGDVVCLLKAHDLLVPQIEELGRTDDFSDEMRKMSALRFQPHSLSHGFKRKLRSLPRHLSALAEGLYWEREKIAERLDVPPFKVVSNDLLVYLAKVRPRNEKEWSAVKGIRPGFRDALEPMKRYMEDYLSRTRS